MGEGGGKVLPHVHLATSPLPLQALSYMFFVMLCPGVDVLGVHPLRNS